MNTWECYRFAKRLLELPICTSSFSVRADQTAGCGILMWSKQPLTNHFQPNGAANLFITYTRFTYHCSFVREAPVTGGFALQRTSNVFMVSLMLPWTSWSTIVGNLKCYESCVMISLLLTILLSDYFYRICWMGGFVILQTLCFDDITQVHFVYVKFSKHLSLLHGLKSSCQHLQDV